MTHESDLVSKNTLVFYVFQAHVHVTKDGQAVVVLLKCRVQMIVQIVGSALMGDVSVILGTLLLRLCAAVEIVCC